MVEAAAQQHERDSRGWKAEWVALPEACLLTTAALDIAIGLLAGLRVNAGAMRRNLARFSGYPASERAMALLTPRLGARQAQARLHEVLGHAAETGLTAEEALVKAGLFSPARARELTAQPDTGACGRMTDLVIERARAARSAEPWPGPSPGRARRCSSPAAHRRSWTR